MSTLIHDDMREMQMKTKKNKIKYITNTPALTHQKHKINKKYCRPDW
jgi:hypothetical protein